MSSVDRGGFDANHRTGAMIGPSSGPESTLGQVAPISFTPRLVGLVIRAGAGERKPKSCGKLITLPGIWRQQFRRQNLHGSAQHHHIDLVRSNKVFQCAAKGFLRVCLY